MPANILVGCGGSGIRSLMRLNGLMAEDPYWRHQIAKDVYYVLLDTELAMIDEFEDTIDRQLTGVDKPLIWSLRVAQGHVILHPLVRRYFQLPFNRDGADQRGKERLYSHWWNHPVHGPFSAPKVRPLTKGAGQCPAASYFLTWHELRNVEDVFDRLIEEVKARRSSSRGEDPLAEMSFSIVAGLAGGTGRGSWQLIAFKVRELLTEKHGIPTPVAYLFDASVFGNIYRRYPRHEVPMKANSLTGVSELSCWLNNPLQPGRAQYGLPSMDTPGDPQLDVLSIDLALDPSGGAPVDSAFLIFGGNQRVVLADNIQYHEMVGTGLYATLTRNSIDAALINQRPPYMSMGTATFEVNAATLRRYFEGLNRIGALQRLSHRDDAAVDQAAEQFLNACCLRINITAANRRGFQADEKGTLMQRACHQLLAKSDLGGLTRSLEDDDPEEVDGEIRRLLDPHQRAAAAAVQRAIDSLPVAPVQAGQQAVSELFRQTQSVENVRRFVEQTVERLEDELEQLPAPQRMQMDQEAHPLKLVEDYKGREYYGILGRHFNAIECDDLEQQTRLALLYANYEVLRDELKQRYRSWIAVIRRWLDSSHVIRATADKLVGKFKNELQDDIGASGSQASDFFDVLFTDEEYPERSTPDEFSKGRFYRRDLRPVLRRGEDLEMLGKPEFKQELAEVISEALLKSGLRDDSYDELEQLRRDLEDAVRRTVHLPPRFIEDHFSIRTVIGRIRRAWLRRFSQAQGRRDELVDLIDQFDAYYGMRPAQDGADFTLPDEYECLLEMGASLAATCRPYWRLRNVAQTEDARVTLFLPVLDENFDKESAERYIAKQLERSNATVEVLTERERPDVLGGNRANPFIIVAYSDEGTYEIKQIASLDYWQTPVVKSLLQDCEDDSGKSVFDPEAQHNGVSYTDPLFIQHDELQQIRWKPWVDEDPSRTVQRNEAFDALLYALLEPDEDLKRQLNELQWTLPLVRDKGQRWYEFTRRAMIWNGGQPRQDTGCPWKGRQPIAQGLGQVVQVLLGSAKNPDGSVKTEGALWADRIRQEAGTFWDDTLLALRSPKRSREYEHLLDRLESALDHQVQNAEADDEDRAVWAGLLERLQELRQSDQL